MKSIIRVICLIIGAAGGFVSGQWKARLKRFGSMPASKAPGVDPRYANALSDGLPEQGADGDEG
jgi:hypothetical protein